MTLTKNSCHVLHHFVWGTTLLLYLSCLPCG